MFVAWSVFLVDTYPGTISDNDITEQCGVLGLVRRGSVVLTDKGFGTTKMSLQKGLHHNRPPLKFDAQYDESEIKTLILPPSDFTMKTT